MHLSPALASSSLHLDFPTVQGNIFLSFFCWLGWVGFLFGFGVGFFTFFFFPPSFIFGHFFPVAGDVGGASQA